MTQYERIAQLEVVLKLRDRRRGRTMKWAASLTILTAIAAICIVIQAF